MCALPPLGYPLGDPVIPARTQIEGFPRSVERRVSQDLAGSRVGGAEIGEPFHKAMLATLYPGGKDEYLVRFTAVLDRAIAAGHLLAEDRAEILAVAAINYDKAP